MVKLIKTIIHLFFWIVFIAISGVMSFNMMQGTGFIESHFAVLLIALLWAMIAFYTFYFFLYQFLEKHKFFSYLFWSLLISTSIALAFILFFRIFIFPGKWNVPQSWNYTTPIGTYVIANCGCLLRGFIAWIDSAQVKSELEKRAISAELEALRAQVNPHFLFNTLNNIDSLIAKEPKKASTAIITLSEIMRYMLYETTNPTVDLSREITHIQNIISLQELRFRHPDYVSFNMIGSAENHQIAPLLFIPFIENAFKFAHFSGKLPVVSINFDISEKEIKFSCSNYYDENASEVTSNGGIGLSNLRKQLTLLYPGEHTLVVEKKNAKFEVVLRIDITNG
jgi:two-component system, LytTR family, sensor kinase